MRAALFAEVVFTLLQEFVNEKLTHGRHDVNTEDVQKVILDHLETGTGFPSNLSIRYCI
jgi:hypothetical protein